MNLVDTGEAPEAAHRRSDLQRELAEVFLCRAAISAVLRAIASSPHDLQPIFDAILDSARQLSRADSVVLRLVEEAGLRLFAESSAEISPPGLAAHGSFYDRLIASKSLTGAIATSRAELDRKCHPSDERRFPKPA